MDGSAFRHLPIGKILAFAIFGGACAVVGGVGGLAYIVWWAVHHVSIN